MADAKESVLATGDGERLLLSEASLGPAALELVVGSNGDFVSSMADVQAFHVLDNEQWLQVSHQHSSQTPDASLTTPCGDMIWDELLDGVLDDIGDISCSQAIAEEVNNNNISQCDYEAPCLTNRSGARVKESTAERNRKNAVLAKKNREKKKQYLQSTETELKMLRQELQEIKRSKLKVDHSYQGMVDERNKAEKDAQLLRRENKFLKHLLTSNSVALGGLVKVVNSSHSKQNIGLPSTPLLVGRGEYNVMSCVCVHVKNNHVHVEVCKTCHNSQ